MTGRHILIVAMPGQGDAKRIGCEQTLEATGASVGLIVEIGRERPRPASLLAPAEARQLGDELARDLTGITFRTRGQLVHAFIDVDADTTSRVRRLREATEDRPLAVISPPGFYRELLETGWDRVLVLTGNEEDALSELVLSEALGFASEVLPVEGSPARSGILARFLSRRGQATPLVLGGVFLLVLGAVVAVAISGAVTGKAKAQRTADLSALSAVDSMKEDLPRLLAPPRLPNGLPNPAHMPKPVYLSRARAAATEVAVANDASPLAVRVRFPDSRSYAPVRARVSISVSVISGSGKAEHRTTPVWAEARISIPVSMGAVPSMASGGGYSGPLAERQGRGMRPDVAAAFDAMSAAAAAAGMVITINSAFRSDAEQAALFAANPDPTWVAPPGQSLHRCATELDLGPPAVYGWLASNAGRFGFVQRYSWEAWHYGFEAGPPPCSEEGNSIGMDGGDRSEALSQSVPSFTPSWVRPLVLRAAMKWNVSAALLAAQLFAESSFDPNAGNGIAFGIAAFTPAAAAEYGLEDPFDPAAAIMAQAHLMSDLLEQFGSPALALAAYNAGPGAVGSCNCIPDYPETQAYVAKILGMLGGMGAIAPIGMSIELVK